MLYLQSRVEKFCSELSHLKFGRVKEKKWKKYSIFSFFSTRVLICYSNITSLYRYIHLYVTINDSWESWRKGKRLCVIKLNIVWDACSFKLNFFPCILLLAKYYTTHTISFHVCTLFGNEILYKHAYYVSCVVGEIVTIDMAFDVQHFNILRIKKIKTLMAFFPKKRNKYVYSWLNNSVMWTDSFLNIFGKQSWVINKWRNLCN